MSCGDLPVTPDQDNVGNGRRRYTADTVPDLYNRLAIRRGHSYEPLPASFRQDIDKKSTPRKATHEDMVSTENDGSQSEDIEPSYVLTASKPRTYPKPLIPQTATLEGINMSRRRRRTVVENCLSDTCDRQTRELPQQDEGFHHPSLGNAKIMLDRRHRLSSEAASIQAPLFEAAEALRPPNELHKKRSRMLKTRLFDWDICSNDSDEDEHMASSPFSGNGDESELPRTHPFQQEIPRLVDIAFASFNECTAHGQQAGEGGRIPNAPCRKRRRSNHNAIHAGRGGQRERAVHHEDDNDDDDDEGQEIQLPASPPPAGSSRPTLACPYYKHDPLRHERCLLLQLKRVKDVKQHVRRNHAQPHFCPVCGITFGKSQTDQQRHVRSRICEEKDFKQPEGVTAEHNIKFNERVKRTHTLSEQWYTVWDILFPQIPRPTTPFISTPFKEAFSELEHHWDCNGRTIISEYLNDNNIEFENLTKNPERDLAAVFNTVGRYTLQKVFKGMRRGSEDSESSSPDSEGLLSPLLDEGGNSSTTTAPATSEETWDSLPAGSPTQPTFDLSNDSRLQMAMLESLPLHQSVTINSTSSVNRLPAWHPADANSHNATNEMQDEYVDFTESTLGPVSTESNIPFPWSTT